MAIPSVNVIGPKKVYPPDVELVRNNYVEANRRLHGGNFADLPIGKVDDAQTGLPLNWFRRVATFYPEFMFAQRPEVTIRNNERFTEALVNLLRPVWPVLQHANVDMLRYGTGVVASDPMDPNLMRRYELDAWYEVVNAQGIVEADILMDVRGSVLSENATIDMIVYPISGLSAEAPSWRQFTYEGKQLGVQRNTFTLPNRDYSRRQVVPFNGNVDAVSIFDDMRPGVTEISRALTGMAAALKRNQRPHLVGPEGMLETDDKGNAQLNPDGMFLPVQPGDANPEYLQYDSAEQSVSIDLETHTDTMLTFAGLTNMLFSPESHSGGLPSGVALRRLLLPFFSRLDYYAQVNNSAIEKIVGVLLANGGANGGEIPQVSQGDIEVVWQYDKVLEDPAVNEPGRFEDRST